MHPSYSVSSEALRSQLEIISNLNFSTITLDELSKGQDYISSAKRLVLSFDDGYISNYLFAFPAVKDRGMVGTFFCAVSLIGKKNMMTWSHLREMAAEKMSVQSHGFLHRPLATLKKKEIYEDLRISKHELENNLGQKVSYLSLPHGSFNKYVINAAREIGYNGICTSSIGYNKGHAYLLKRILVRSEYSLDKYEELITGRSSLSLLRFSEKMKSLIKNTIGHGNYLKLYHSFIRIGKNK